MRTIGILLAAGVSRRFGADDKLLADWRGTPLVRAAAQRLSQAGCDEFAAIVSSDLVATLLPAHFRVLHVAPGQAMSASFQAACTLADDRDADRMLIALGDMPAISVETLDWLLDAPESRACQVGEIRLPPAALMRRDWQNAPSDAGDFGARYIIGQLPTSAIRHLSAEEAIDIDTPQDIASD